MKLYIIKNIIFFTILILFSIQLPSCFRRYNVATRDLLKNEKNDESWVKTEEKELEETNKTQKKQKAVDVKAVDL